MITKVEIPKKIAGGFKYYGKYSNITDLNRAIGIVKEYYRYYQVRKYKRVDKYRAYAYVIFVVK